MVTPGRPSASSAFHRARDAEKIGVAEPAASAGNPLPDPMPARSGTCGDGHNQWATVTHAFPTSGARDGGEAPRAQAGCTFLRISLPPRGQKAPLPWRAHTHVSLQTRCPYTPVTLAARGLSVIGKGECLLLGPAPGLCMPRCATCPPP